MIKQTAILILISFVLGFSSCSSDDAIDGGPCSYEQYEGLAMIIAIEDAPAGENNCPDNPKRVAYKFKPNDISVVDSYLFPNVQDSLQYFEIGNGQNPSQAWLDNNEMEVGSEYTVVREEITQGTCTPVIFTFTDPSLDLDGACD